MSVKISELPILDSLADNDIVAGVDVSGNVTSKIEMSTLKNYIDTNTQYTAGTNIDITNNVVSAPNVYNKTETDGLIDDLETNINEQLEEKDEQIEELQNEVDSLSTIFNAFPTESGEGESVTLDDTAEVTFKKLDLKGNTSQDGTPTPTSPIPVNVVSGDNEINVVGKNLLNPSNCTLFNSSKYISTINYSTKGTIKVEPNTSYVFIIDKNISMPDMGVYEFDINNSNKATMTRTAIGSDVWNTQKVTTSATTHFISFYRGNGNGTAYSSVSELLDVTKFMLVKEADIPSTLSEYEPYQGNTYNIDLPSGMELCKIGTYQDYIYKDSDKWYLYKAIGKVVLNGSETTWARADGNNDYRDFRIPINNIALANSEPIGYIDNRFVAKTSRYWNENAEHLVQMNDKRLSFRIAVSRLTDSTRESWISWLTNNHITTYYGLETPTTTEITDTTLISQLNELEKAMSKDSQTNISQVNNDLGFIIYAEAIKSLENVLDRIELLES